MFSLSTQTFEDWAAQMGWIQTAVAAQHPNKWKVAFFHHPVYTTQTLAGHEPNEKGQNPFYGPAFDAAGMDIIFQSHNHIYERFRPLRYNPNDPNEGMEVQTYGNGPNDGRLYVVSGGSGAFLDPLIEFGSGANGSESRSADHHFMKISIAGNTLTYSAIRTTAGNSSGGGDIIDSLTITRPGPDPCANPMDPDMDMDGYAMSIDCNDGDPAINPGAAEVCGNTVDEDCNGTAEDCPEPPVDMDGDGSPADSDCDDNDPNRFPEHPEDPCDGIDNDCDCFEICDAQIDVCSPPPEDAGTPDATEEAGMPPPPPPPPPPAPTKDAGAQEEETVIDASDCGCTAAERKGSPAMFLLLGLLFLRVRFRSCTRS